MKQRKPRSKFAVIILSHGRANELHTLKTLDKCEYNGPLHIVIDNLDTQLDEYKVKYGDKLVIFDKEEYYAKTDTFNNFHKLNAAVFARNFILDWARDKYEYILMLDDDIKNIKYRYICDDMIKKRMFRINETSEAIIDYMEACGIHFIGLHNDGIMFKDTLNKVGRIIQQGIYVKTDTNARFSGQVYEDYNISALCGCTGTKMFELPFITVGSAEQGTNSGGVEYDNRYISSFYSVMCAPFSTKITNSKFNELTIKKLVNNMCFKTIREEYKKW